MVPNEYMLYAGSALLILWGTGHVIPTKDVVRGFGDIEDDNALIIKMEWVNEAFTLWFVGVLTAVLTYFHGFENPASITVYWLCALMLLAMAGWHEITGARTSILPMKLCPAVMLFASVLLILGIVL